MKVNIENCAAKLGDIDGHQKGRQFLIQEMVGHLKELRERTAAGDFTVLDEFFELYFFNGDDDKKYERSLSK